ncbi:hssA/2C/7E family protein [Dictyostelium discoideum AX4]|uniref:HssA/B-like protein 4 n=1 Tax=Dictyostelium discoideum TaxID=44689 RepID=HSL4_DICDI|nr:hssA/2C/7E family protein [Dictyostelium discoideum AX4]Q55FC7.1 RecName: Full=HssA/B-like protein 4 [Dictyostelium discoideum]EAL73538.1 hssA/2C/7E family protein [Dictyostelium discoideum AX4]|eukprot:XP_647606.1 hssA/2C/7E family protein [Dictyostelium discoideum AX4]
MSILSSLISISNPMKSSKSSVANGGGSSLSMGSNSIACGSCGSNGGNGRKRLPSDYTNIDSNAGSYTTASGSTYSYSYSYGYYSGSCGCN